MGNLYLVRHGQASFGAADYDQLSELGHQQCRHLGAYWRECGQHFDAVFTGTLRRHAQSLAGIAEGYGNGLLAPVALPG
ncbi:histidine phosphatase family protein, partial [Streptococcus pyogenes]